MKHPLPDGVFKPKRTAIETRQDAITKAARAIIDHEASARVMKTERLRAARLAAESRRAAPAPAPKPATRRKAASTPAGGRLQERS